MNVVLITLQATGIVRSSVSLKLLTLEKKSGKAVAVLSG